MQGHQHKVCAYVLAIGIAAGALFLTPGQASAQTPPSAF
jgi:hypothetical protein